MTPNQLLLKKKNEVKVNHKRQKLCEEKTVESVKGLLL